MPDQVAAAFGPVLIGLFLVGGVLVAGCGATGRISGVARVTPSFCSGHPPDPDDEADMQDVPIRTPLFVYSGTSYTGGQPIATIMPRADGKFSIKLPPGQYCVITSEHSALDAPIDSNADAPCVRTLRQRCEATWIVDAKGARSTTVNSMDIVVPTSCSWQRPCYPPGPKAG